MKRKPSRPVEELAHILWDLSGQGFMVFRSREARYEVARKIAVILGFDAWEDEWQKDDHPHACRAGAHGRGTGS